MPFLDLTASIIAPDVKEERVKLRQTGIATYEGEFKADAAGRYEVAVVDRGSSSPTSSAAYGGAAKPFCEESTSLRADTRTIHRLANMGGGRIMSAEDAAGSAYRRDGLVPAVQYRDCWMFLLVLTACLFPLDVFVRRVMIDYGEAGRWLRNRYALWRGRTLPREDRVSRLMEAKHRAVRNHPTPTFLNDAPERLESKAPFVGIHQLKPAADMHREADTVMNPEEESEAQPDSDPASHANEETYTGRLLRAKNRLRQR